MHYLSQIKHDQAGSPDWIVTNAICDDKGEVRPRQHHHLACLVQDFCIVGDEAIHVAAAVECVENLPIIVTLGEPGVVLGKTREPEAFRPQQVRYLPGEVVIQNKVGVQRYRVALLRSLPDK